MIKVYLKQAWELLKQNKLFSMLYIVGTGLAIAMTMVMAMVYYVKIAPVYPEVNRLNTLYLSKLQDGRSGSGKEYQVSISVGGILQGFARVVLSYQRMHFVVSAAAG